MSKPLTILPNFTIVADKNDPNYSTMKKDSLLGRLASHGERTSIGAQADVFKITPETFWHGMNIDEGVDFLKFIQANSESVPENVLTELTKFALRFGVVTLIGDDCIRINNPEVLKEVLNNTSIKEHIYSQEENLIFFRGIPFAVLTSFFEREIGYPIKVHRPKVQVFIISLSKEVTYSIKASSALEAFRALYDKTVFLNEAALRIRLKIKREVTAEDIDKFMEIVFTEDKPTVFAIHPQTTYSAIRLLI